MKKEKKSVKSYFAIKVIILLVLSYLIWFFLEVKYNDSILFSLVAAVIFFLISYRLWDKGFFHFFLFTLTSTCFFIVLEISFELGLIINFILTMIFSLIISKIYLKKETNEGYALLLLYGFIVIWIINGFNVLDRTDWILENALNVPFIIVLALLSKWFRFSKLSYSLFFIYMFMNVVGSHYTYALVPFGDWLEGFFGLTRNHYDRIIHFLFGFLLAYPLREVYVRVGNYKGIWALVAPVVMVFGLSAVYEIIEWWIAVIFGGDLGIAYLGSQGDVWDAQQDMLLAGLGSIIAMAIVFLVLILIEKKKFLFEFADSFRVKKKRELGEEEIARVVKKK